MPAGTGLGASVPLHTDLSMAVCLSHGIMAGIKNEHLKREEVEAASFLRGLVLKTDTLSLLDNSIGQIVAKSRFKDRRHRFHLSVGGVSKYLWPSFISATKILP